MHFVLVDPPQPSALRYNAEMGKAAPILPSLGLLYIAAAMEKSGHVPEIIDCMLENHTEEEAADAIMGRNPDVVGLRCWTSNFHRVLHLCRLLKDRIPRIPIVLGGPHPSMHPFETVADPSVDYIVQGEGEETIVELAEALASGLSPAALAERLQGINGIGFKRPLPDGTMEPHVTPRRALITNLDDLPLPARHLVDMKRYRGGPQHARQHPSTTLIASRGCPFNCSFCDAIMIWTRHYRTRTPADVVREIRMLHDTHGIRDVSFWDDLWGLNPKWSLEFCRLLKNENLGITWSCECRVDTVKPDLLKTWADAGCWCIFYGLESMDEEVLGIINKETTPDQIRNAVRWTREAGIEIRGNFIVGLPGETPEKIRRMFREICRLGIDYVKFNIFTPYPGTPLYQEIRSGRWGHFEENLDHLTGYHATFCPSGYESVASVERMQKRLHRSYYLRLGYVLPRLLGIRSWADVSKYWTGFKALLGSRSGGKREA